MNITNANPLLLPNYTLVLTGVSSGLSILGCVVIFVTYYIFEEIRNSNRKLLVYLTIADLLTGIGYFAGNVHYYVYYYVYYNDTGTKPDTECVAQSCLTTFSNMASYFWTVVIAIHMVTLVIYHTDMTTKPVCRMLYHVVCWGVPGVIAFVALYNDVYGVDYVIGSGSWCFIRSDLTPRWRLTMWILGAAAGWEILCYLVTCMLYMYLKFYLSRRYQRTELHDVEVTLRNEDKNFMYVWLVLYLLKMWGTIRFLIITFKPDVYDSGEGWRTLLTILLNLQSFGAAGQGFWNFVMFCVCDKTVRSNARGYFRHCCRGNSAERTRLIQRESTDICNVTENEAVIF